MQGHGMQVGQQGATAVHHQNGAHPYHKRKQRTPPTPSFLAHSKHPRHGAASPPAGFETPHNSRVRGRVSLPHLQFSASSLASLTDGSKRETRHSMPAIVPANRKQLPPLSGQSPGSSGCSPRTSGSRHSSIGHHTATPSPRVSPHLAVTRYGDGASTGAAAVASPPTSARSSPSPGGFRPGHPGSSFRKHQVAGAVAFDVSGGGGGGAGGSGFRVHHMPAPTPKGGPPRSFFADMSDEEGVQAITASMGKLQSPRTGGAFVFGADSAAVTGSGGSHDSTTDRRRRRSSGSLQPLPFHTPVAPALRSVVTPDDVRAMSEEQARAAAALQPGLGFSRADPLLGGGGGGGGGGGAAPFAGAGAGVGAGTDTNASPAMLVIDSPSPSSMFSSPGSATGFEVKPPSTGSPKPVPRKRGRRRRPMGLKLNVGAAVDDVAAPSYDLPTTKLTQCSSTLAAVEDFLYVGGMDAAKDLSKLRDIGITHVLNCVGATAPNCFPDQFTYCTLELSDRTTQDITCFAYPMIEFIERARASNGKVLVHCVKGISRSTSAVIVYLIWRHNWGFETAFRRVKQARREANPNAAFALQISDWERIRASQRSSGRPLCYRVGVHPTKLGTIPLAVGPLASLQLGMFLDSSSPGNGGTGAFGAGGATAGPGPARAASPASRAVSMARAFLVVGSSVCYVWHDPHEAPHVVEAARRLATVAATLEASSPCDVVVVVAGDEPSGFWHALRDVHGSAVTLAPGLQAYCAEKSILGRTGSTMMTADPEAQMKWGDSSVSSGSLFHKSSSSTAMLQHMASGGNSMGNMSFVSQSPGSSPRMGSHRQDVVSSNSEDEEVKAAQSDEDMGM